MPNITNINHENIYCRVHHKILISSIRSWKVRIFYNSKSRTLRIKWHHPLIKVGEILVVEPMVILMRKEPEVLIERRSAPYSCVSFVQHHGTTIFLITIKVKSFPYDQGIPQPVFFLGKGIAPPPRTRNVEMQGNFGFTNTTILFTI